MCWNTTSDPHLSLPSLEFGFHSGAECAVVTDRPIIFSGPMVRALLDGRKTQTRRLATSPLRRCVAGDRLYVRESWSHSGEGVWSIGDARMATSGRPLYYSSGDGDPGVRWWPSIHMPRVFSRLTLIIEAVLVQPLQAITWDDARAEGLSGLSKDGKLVKFGIPDRDGLPGSDDDGWHWQEWNVDPTAAYARLWSSLHTKPGERWEDNPAVVALTFRVLRGNIDEVPA